MLNEAAERGEFQNLPNAGETIDLTDYFNTPKELRLAASVLKSAGLKPHEAELLENIAALKKELEKHPNTPENAEKRQKIQKRIEMLQMEFNMAVERIKEERRRRGESSLSIF